MPVAKNKNRIHRIASRTYHYEIWRKMEWLPPWKRSLALVALLSVLSICGRTFGDEAMLKVVRIGYQTYGSFNVVKARHAFDNQLAERGIKVDWVLFPAGPQLLEAMNAGAIDLLHTGEAPPIFAQVANNPLVYVGNQRPDPSGEAILVTEKSSIKIVAILSQKRLRETKNGRSTICSTKPWKKRA